jgi:hypothetical protein
MTRIILGCNLMRFPYFGWYNCCLNLGLYLNKLLTNGRQQKIFLYLPPNEAVAVGNAAICIKETKWYKNFLKPLLRNCPTWRVSFKLGSILLKKNKRTKIVLAIYYLNYLPQGQPYKERIESLRCAPFTSTLNIF